MRWVFEVIGNLLGRGERKAKVIKVEGSQTPAAKGKTKRLNAERKRKEDLTLIGNKSAEDKSLEDL